MNYKTGKWGKKKCQECGEITTNIKFCSNQCQQDFLWADRKNEIELAGEITERRQGIRYLKETREEGCEICSTDRWNGKNLILVMDHIDGDSSNNTLSNLRLICSNCDSQLPTYKNRNKGRGRHSRRERYAAGKSY